MIYNSYIILKSKNIIIIANSKPAMRARDVLSYRILYTIIYLLNYTRRCNSFRKIQNLLPKLYIILFFIIVMYIRLHVHKSMDRGISGEKER